MDNKSQNKNINKSNLKLFFSGQAASSTNLVSLASRSKSDPISCETYEFVKLWLKNGRLYNSQELVLDLFQMGDFDISILHFLHYLGGRI